MIRARGSIGRVTEQIVDLTDTQAREALVLKWGSVPADVLPAWVAEMDYDIAPCIKAALHSAVEIGGVGYPRFESGGELGTSYAAWAGRQFAHAVDPAWVLPVVDVTAGVRLALDLLSDPAPVVLPNPAYFPQLAIAQITGRERVDLTLPAGAPQARIDLDELDRLFAAGARTLILTQPHNPWGRVFTRAELEGIRDVVARHGARVIADEIHAPLALDGVEHVPYLSIDGTAEHAVSVVAASKAFNTAGLKCAQIVVPDDVTRQKFLDAPMALNDSWSQLGVVAAVSAYRDGDEWLAALRVRLSAQRDLLGQLLSEHLPRARMRRVEATFLAWIDLRSYGHDDPAAVALDRGRVQLAPGHDYGPGLTGHVRLNFATSPERLTEIVRRLAAALT